MVSDLLKVSGGTRILTQAVSLQSLSSSLLCYTVSITALITLIKCSSLPIKCKILKHKEFYSPLNPQGFNKAWNWQTLNRCLLHEWINEW